MFGYLGGVAWAILVAKICMVCPNQAPNKLLYYFFKYYSEWDWGCENPIYLKEILIDRQIVNFPVDNELFYEKRQTDIMPIITPAFPSQNATYNVSRSTKNAMLTEFQKGLKITEALLKGDSHQISWRRLLKKFNFFRAYQHFI